MAVRLLLVTPSLKPYYARVAAVISEHWCELDKLFLPLPQGSEKVLLLLMTKSIKPDEAVVLLAQRQPYMVKFYEPLKPLLKTLAGLVGKGRVEVHCYKTRMTELIEASFASSAIALMARVVVTGKVQVDKWKKLLQDYTVNTDVALSCEAKLIAEDLELSDNFIIVAGLNGWKLAKKLKQLGVQVTAKLIAPYVPTPLEQLSLCRAGDIERLVKEHAKYISDYLLTSKSREEAYFKWLKRMIPDEAYSVVLGLLGVMTSPETEA